MSGQLAMQMPVRPEEVMRERSLGAAIELCAKVGGHALDKTLQSELGVDKAQFSRWQSGAEGVVWPKLERLMTTCGNDAPLLWMAYQRGYDLNSMRHRETELERQNRHLREEVSALRRVVSGGSRNA